MGYKGTVRCITSMARSKGLPALSKEKRDYVRKFSIKYLKSRSREDIAKEIGWEKGALMRGNNLAAEVSKKVSSSRRFQYEFLKKWTGAKTLEELKKTGIIPSFGYFLSGRDFASAEKATSYAVELASSFGMTPLSPENQRYVDNFTVEYVRDTPSEKLKEKIRMKGGNIGHNPFFRELSKKISSDPELQYELFMKWTGVSVMEQIRASSSDGILGYHSLRGFAHLIFGEVMNSVTEVGNRFRELAKKNRMPGYSAMTKRRKTA